MCYMDKKNMCDAKVSPVRPDTSSSYLRKIKKPLIERKRRERINNCLAQLKSILLENIKQNGGTQVSKLDKADILEMTVSHLRQIHHQQLSAAMASSSSVITQYREGYTECATETVRYMEASRAYPADVVMRMRHNLAAKIGYARDYAAHARCAMSAPPSDIATITKPRDCTPVKVKVESLSSPTKSVSPDSGFDSAFSPLLMTVPGIKHEKHHDSETEKNSSMCSTSDSSMYYTSSSGNTTLDTSTEQSTSDTSLEHSNKSSDTSGDKAALALPERAPAAGSPPPKQVWRPF